LSEADVEDFVKVFAHVVAAIAEAFERLPTELIACEATPPRSGEGEKDGGSPRIASTSNFRLPLSASGRGLGGGVGFTTAQFIKVWFRADP
jgi:hypothetical protein